MRLSYDGGMEEESWLTAEELTHRLGRSCKRLVEAYLAAARKPVQGELANWLGLTATQAMRTTMKLSV